MPRSYSTRDAAVSPVVGVMLMLVVVIIIGALVSAFGGSMMSNEKKVPQASFTGSYSQYNGLSITHMGGDSLETENTRIVIRPSEEFGKGQSLYGQLLVNESTITNGKPDYGMNNLSGSLRYWRNVSGGTYGITSWRPGETMYVNGGADLVGSGLTKTWPPCYNENLGRGKDNCYVTDLNNQYNIGKKLTVEIMQRNGKMISSFDIIVQP